MSEPPQIVVFAHVPPPLHGQSRMIELLLSGLAGSGWEIRGGPCATAASRRPGSVVRGVIHHVDARVSEGLRDVGGMRPGKLLRLAGHCLAALRVRAGRRAHTLYYVPAPAKRSAVVRDLLALGVLRPFFPRLVLHWHALGLGRWAVRGTTPDGRPLFGPLEPGLRGLTRRILGGATLSIALAPDGGEEAEALGCSDCRLIPNGLPDPCPDYDSELQGRRERRAADLASGRFGTLRLLFLAACTEAKGLFDALEALAVLRPLLPAGSGVELTVAGTFVSSAEEARFERWVQEHGTVGTIRRLGQLDDADKRRELAGHDLLLVPSHGESFGLTLLEAMAFGLELAVSDLPSFRSILGPLAPARTASRAPGEPAGAALARTVLGVMASPAPGVLRRRYLEEFGIGVWVERMDAALRDVAGGG